MTTQIITRTTGRKAGSTFGAEPSSRIATRPIVWKWVAAAALLAGLAACSNNDDSWSPQVSGKVTYDHVPTASSGSGDSATAKLDYDATAVMPARNIVVELVDNASGDVLESTTTADDGSYTLKLPVSATVYLRARAHSVHGSPDAPDWSFTVRDNTTGDISADPDSTLEYSIVGEAFDTGFENHSRDLHAASGWTGSGYDAAARAAGPFQVLEPPAAQAVTTPDIVLTPLLGFDAKGGRLGYGAGFYDVTFATMAAAGDVPLRVGLCFACQEVAEVPVGPADVTLELIITEAGLRRAAP